MELGLWRLEEIVELVRRDIEFRVPMCRGIKIAVESEDSLFIDARGVPQPIRSSCIDHAMRMLSAYLYRYAKVVVKNVCSDRGCRARVVEIPTLLAAGDKLSKTIAFAALTRVLYDYGYVDSLLLEALAKLVSRARARIDGGKAVVEVEKSSDVERLLRILETKRMARIVRMDSDRIVFEIDRRIVEWFSRDIG